MPVEQHVCENEAGLGPQHLTLMLEREVKLDDSGTQYILAKRNPQF